MGWLAGCALPGATLGPGVGLRSTAEAAMTTGEAAMLGTAASDGTLLIVGGSAVRALLADLPGASAAHEPAGMVARDLAGILVDARTVARLVAAW